MARLSTLGADLRALQRYAICPRPTPHGLLNSHDQIEVVGRKFDAQASLRPMYGLTAGRMKARLSAKMAAYRPFQIKLGSFSLSHVSNGKIWPEHTFADGENLPFSAS